MDRIHEKRLFNGAAICIIAIHFLSSLTGIYIYHKSLYTQGLVFLIGSGITVFTFWGAYTLRAKLNISGKNLILKSVKGLIINFVVIETFLLIAFAGYLHWGKIKSVPIGLSLYATLLFLCISVFLAYWHIEGLKQLKNIQ